tara:strand:- start:26140 stop:26403 length:264 start_codon:yes stop_codon:yes gene_type:complete
MEYLAIGLLVLLAVGVYFWRDTSSSPVVVDTPSEVVADANDNGITSKAELNRLTKAQLIEFADKRNLSIKRSAKKASVVNSIHSQIK